MPFFPKSVKVLSRLLAAGFCLVLASRALRADPISLSAGFVPLSSIDYISAPDASGVRLVLGECTLQAFAAIRDLPLPSSDNQQFLNSSIELAPEQFFSHVYVPTSAERFGDFRDFGGPIYDPWSGLFFVRNVIPMDLLAGVYAFRIGPESTVPEPQSGIFAAAWFALALLLRHQPAAGRSR